MLNRDALDLLPNDQKRDILEMYERVRNGEMSVYELQQRCEKMLGKEISSNIIKEPGRRGRPPLNKDGLLEKPEYMSDVIKYAGVDLREEAQNIAQESEGSLGSNEAAAKDYRNTPEFLFDIKNYMIFTGRISRMRETTLSEGALQMIFLAVRRKLLDLMEKLIYQSKLRMDVARNEYLIRIENDTRRQLWFLEQEERMEMEKFRRKGEENEGKKKWRRMLQEREDLIIKKRLSNNVALAALGSQPKSWMSTGVSQATDDGSAPYLNLFQGSEGDRGTKGGSRVIIKEDFFSVLSRDKRYNKSIFTIKHFYL
jgi:Transcription initiation factor TFIID component TAF4 family